MHVGAAAPSRLGLAAGFNAFSERLPAGEAAVHNQAAAVHEREVQPDSGWACIQEDSGI